MVLIAAVDTNWAIGKKGELLYRIPDDLRHFRALTNGVDTVVVYGHDTLKTLPDGAPLKGRINLILSHDKDFTCKGATVIHSLDELEKYPSDKICVIGGASVYSQLYERCEYAYLTEVDSTTPECDAFFPNLQKKGWEVIRPTQWKCCDSTHLSYRFVTYKNPNIQ